MTLAQFIKVINPDTNVKVFDKWGFIDFYNANMLFKDFCEQTRIIEIKADENNTLAITIDYYI